MANDTNDTGNDLGPMALLAMAAASGIAVANIYYNQPMLGLIRASFPGDAAADLIPTATQLGYALGLFLLVPFGDIVNRRRLIVIQFLLLALALVAAALAPTAWILVVASLLVGVGSTVAQQILPHATALAPPERRGAVIGTVMAGLFTGILLSRTLSGFVGEHFGWREMFWIGVPLALIAAAGMGLVLGDRAPLSRLPYVAALLSLSGLWRRHRSLRAATFTQASLFGAFSAFWTVLALYLATPRFSLGADVAGLFGVVGAVGVLSAPIAGRIADRRGPFFVIGLGATVTLAAWMIFGLWASLAALVIGVILLDFGVQGAMVSNQHIVFSLEPEARSRLNTIYMTGMFLGGAASSALATLAWSLTGWSGVSVLGAALALAALAFRLADHIARRRN